MPRLRAWQWAALAGGALPLVALFLFVTLQPLKVLPRIALAPGFALTDHAGARLSNESLRGQLLLYSFLPAHCGARCAPDEAFLQQVQAEAGLPVTLVTILFDVAPGDPALAAYARRVGAEPGRWHILTGEAARLKQLIGGSFRLFYEADGAGGYQFDQKMVLVDQLGIMRAEYSHRLPELAELQRDVALLEQERQQSRGATRYAYEAAHLFLCYPR